MTARTLAGAARRALIFAGAVSLAACEVNLNSEGIVSRETKTFKIAGTPDVQLDTFDGAIEVHSWDKNEVEIEVERRAMEQALVDEIKISAEQDGDRIVLKVTGPERRRGFDGIQVGVHFSPSAKLRVALPRKSQLMAKSGDGSISVEDVSGKLTLNTNDGSVRGTRLAGEIVVRSGDGSIRMERIEGNVDLETSDGSITLGARPTILHAKTSDGTIRMQIEPDTTMTGNWDVQTDDGTVVLTLPTSFNGELDAETRDGSVRANHPALSAEMRSGEDRDERRRKLKATLGSGGPTFRVRSGDGTIRIEH